MRPGEKIFPGQVLTRINKMGPGCSTWNIPARGGGEKTARELQKGLGLCTRGTMPAPAGLAARNPVSGKAKWAASSRPGTTFLFLHRRRKKRRALLTCCQPEPPACSAQLRGAARAEGGRREKARRSVQEPWEPRQAGWRHWRGRRQADGRWES